MADFSFDNPIETGSGGGEIGGVGSPPGVGPGENNGNGEDNSGIVGVADRGTGTVTPDIGVATKKRGRKPLPRDAAGNIIRDATAGAPGARVQTGEKLDLGFKPNDRIKVLSQIQGMHGAVALLTQQQVVNLSEPEAKALTNSLCDVLDYHKISLTSVGGPLGLYVALGLTGYSIYAPRVKALKATRVVPKRPATAPATPDNVTTVIKNRGGMMDFSADLQTEMNS